eukprot:CAMPEP_0119396572 /NCGR_PEP_ID=MMETSP1334-20130426/137500_1 /TAXON_ID=127549 /ORGANISM="Calcidiscus leptoporus, Strain RCC1130" /LENGTH=32 /DNA_ID= /DNA_START= /DNA_END= /DNA_ORIENTATION=
MTRAKSAGRAEVAPTALMTSTVGQLSSATSSS